MYKMYWYHLHQMVSYYFLDMNDICRDQAHRDLHKFDSIYTEYIRPYYHLILWEDRKLYNMYLLLEVHSRRH